jgi:hypothetical protein
VDRTTSTEDKDRSTLVLPGAQDCLVSQVGDQNANTIVYAETVGPIEVSARGISAGPLQDPLQRTGVPRRGGARVRA